MSHRHWRDLKSICVPHWARGATSHVTVKVSFTGGSEQWSMSWLRPSTPTLIRFIRLRTKTPRKKDSVFFFCYIAYDFLFPTIQKGDWESSREGKKEEKTRYCNCLKGHLPRAVKARSEVCRHKPLWHLPTTLMAVCFPPYQALGKDTIVHTFLNSQQK